MRRNIVRIAVVGAILIGVGFLLWYKLRLPSGVVQGIAARGGVTLSDDYARMGSGSLSIGDLATGRFRSESTFCWPKPEGGRCRVLN